MLRILLAAAALTAVATIGPRPADAYGHAPWCAVMDIGWEEVVWDCSYWTIEACVPNVIAGNRGFCNPNPAFRGPLERSHRHIYRHRRHR